MTNLSSATEFSSLCVEYISISLKCNHFIYLMFYLVFGLIHLRFIKKSISNCNTFSSFKGRTHGYLLKLSLTHNKKKRIYLSNLLINHIPYW